MNLRILSLKTIVNSQVLCLQRCLIFLPIEETTRMVLLELANLKVSQTLWLSYSNSFVIQTLKGNSIMSALDVLPNGY